jgi:hypothetical protein
MDLINFVVSLTVGVVIGWFAKRMLSAQHDRRTVKITPFEAASSERT